MNWVTIIWSMTASACLTLALVHGLVCWRRGERAHALFALSALATAAFAFGELWMMRAATPAAFGTAMRWAHVPVWVLMVSLVWFVRQYLRAGRLWLAWAVCAARTLSLILNFVLTPNLNYREITALRHIPFLGESVAVAQGEPNPWMLVGQLSLLLFVVFVADASFTVWRRGDRRQALVVGGSILLFGLAGSVQAVLVFWGILQAPITASLFYLGLVVAMGYELGQDLLHAAQLSIELQQSEERMKLAATAAGLAVWRWDVTQDSFWVGTNGRALYGILPDEAITLRRLLQTVHSEDRDGVRESVARSMEGEGDYRAEYRVALPDGTTRWIIARGRMEFNDGHRARQLLGVSIDITERKRAELEAVRQRGELAHLSRVATLSELSGSLAHELNQPLAIILSNAQAAQRFLVQTPPDLTEVRDILADIVSEDRRAGEVIQGLRALLKRGETCLQPLAIDEVIEPVLRLAGTDLLGRGVALSRELMDGPPPVRGDRVQLQQVVLNLILNACDAVAAHPLVERRVHVATALRDGEMRISVSDTGVGLPADTERIFEPFFTTKPLGLGLGLAISRSIASAHRGRLWAEANAERGATFHLALPISEEN
jgi:two-component system, LuxR family, sensor kinase FixL